MRCRFVQTKYDPKEYRRHCCSNKEALISSREKRVAFVAFSIAWGFSEHGGPTEVWISVDYIISFYAKGNCLEVSYCWKY